MTQELLAFLHQFRSRHLPRTFRSRSGSRRVFTVLTWFWACNPGQAWWRKRDLVTDLCYWFFIPVITRYLRIGMLIVGAALLFRITTADGLIAFYDNGHGPLAALPLAAQMVIFLHRRGYHSVLDAPPVPQPAHVAVPRGAPLLRRAGMDLGGALPSGQSVSRQRGSRRHHASPRHLAQRVCRARSLHHRNFGLRARQSQLDAWPVQIRDCRSGVPPLASHRSPTAAARRTLRRRSRSWTCCSAHFTCRPASYPIKYGIG